MVPRITVEELALIRRDDQTRPLLLLDVREEGEVEMAAIAGDDVVVAPLSELAQRGVGALPPPALDKSRKIVVFCHHGIRSLDVASWLLSSGWTDVMNLDGGIDAYADRIDPTVGRY